MSDGAVAAGEANCAEQPRNEAPELAVEEPAPARPQAGAAGELGDTAPTAAAQPGGAMVHGVPWRGGGAVAAPGATAAAAAAAVSAGGGPPEDALGRLELSASPQPPLEAAAVAGVPQTSEADDMRERAHRLCREYLHGAWRTAAPHQLIIRKVSGGLSNLLFYCALPESLAPQQGEPARVLLRLYGQIHGDSALDGLITESVIFTLLSESQRGPRLLGVFPGGRIEEYIPARPLLTNELSDSKLSCLIAEKMAQIHLMNVPISKEPRWLWDTMERWMGTIQAFMGQRQVPPQFQTMFSKLLQYNLRLEFRWLKEFLEDVKSPVVFCHNDIQEGNILLRNGEGLFPEYELQLPMNGSNGLDRDEQNNENELVIIDFEYCAYNYRGFDFANHMCEWTYDYSNVEHPYFWACPQNFPTKEQQERFFISYLKTIHKEPQNTNGLNNCEEFLNDMEQMLWETKAFTLASHFFWGLWSVVNATVSKITFDYWAYGENRFEAYFKHKKNVLSNEDNTGVPYHCSLLHTK